MTRRRTPAALPADPGDLSWSRLVQYVEVTTTWTRTDGLLLYLHEKPPEGFTLAHGRAITDDDVADVLRVLGLAPADVRVSYARSPVQREFVTTRGEVVRAAVKTGPGIGRTA